MIVVLFVLIIVGMFAFSHVKKTEINNPEQPSVVTEDIVLPYENVKRVDAKHYFIDGVHTFVGEIELPTPCDLLEGEAVIMESYPEKINLDFTVINTSDTCTQVITNQRFMIEAQASEEASVVASFMGRDVELNLIPAAEGETPDEFELFIKG